MASLLHQHRSDCAGASFCDAYLVREIHGAGGLLCAPPADWPGSGVVVLLSDIVIPSNSGLAGLSLV